MTSGPTPEGNSPSDDAQRVDRLRGWRNRPDSFKPLEGALSGAMKELNDRKRRLRGAGEAWAEAVPPEIRDRVVLIRSERGTLVVRPVDATAAFELDRWLRGRGLEQLRAASGGAIQRVRTGTEGGRRT